MRNQIIIETVALKLHLRYVDRLPFAQQLPVIHKVADELKVAMTPELAWECYQKARGF